MAAEPPKRRRQTLTELNPHLSCILCGGYFIDATTITECLHSFCRACIVRYLETSKYCPVCEVQVHRTRPLRCIRSDKTLQDIVYKVVPGLFQNEMKRRRELYASQPPEALKNSPDEEDRGEGIEKRYIYSPDEVFSLTLQYQSNNKPDDTTDGACKQEEPTYYEAMRRFLRCPAKIKISHLKKFIRYKYDIKNSFVIELQYKDGRLDDDYSLMDVAYIFSWKRAGPLQFTFWIKQRPILPKLSSYGPNKSDTKGLSADSQNAISFQNGGVSQGKGSTMCSTIVEDVRENGSHPEIISTQETDGENTNSAKEVSGDLAPLSQETGDSPKCPIMKGLLSVKEKVAVASGKTNDPETSAPRTENNLETRSGNDRNSEEKDESKSIIVSLKLQESPPLKVPKLTIPLTAKILEQAARHAEEEEEDDEEDKIDLDNELYEGRLVIAEPETLYKDADLQDNKESTVLVDDIEQEKNETVDDSEVDSGKASSVCGNDDICSPGSFTIRSPDSSTIPSPDYEKPNPLATVPASTSTTSSLSKNDIPSNNEKVKSTNCSSPPKDDFGVLDLSTCNRKRLRDSSPIPRPKQVANPPVLDKNRQTVPCLSVPKHPSFKLLPAVLPHASIYKKSDHSRGNFRYSRGSTLTVINPDPNSCRPKIVIKNLDPRPEHKHHHHHNHHHHKM